MRYKPGTAPVALYISCQCTAPNFPKCGDSPISMWLVQGITTDEQQSWDLNPCVSIKPMHPYAPAMMNSFMISNVQFWSDPWDFAHTLPPSLKTLKLFCFLLLEDVLLMLQSSGWEILLQHTIQSHRPGQAEIFSLFPHLLLCNLR